MSDKLKKLYIEPGDIKPVSGFLLYSYIGFTLFVVASPFFSETRIFKNLIEEVPFIAFVTYVLELVLLYKIWAIIQVGSVRTTPGRAVGFLFIPIYGFYWFFKAFVGWVNDYNKILSKSGLEQPRIRPVAGLVAALAPIILLIGLFVKFETDQKGLYVIREKSLFSYFMKVS